MEITLPRVLPHMVIDSLVENGNGSMSTLPIEFDQSQKIELEGDFHNYFSLYAPDKYGISALTIIAPDAIEIIDNKLYFYWPKVANEKQDYEQIFQAVGEVLSEIGMKLSRGDIFADASQAKVHAQANGQGVRLKKSGLKLITVLGVIGFIGIQFGRMFDGVMAALPVLIFIGAVLYIARREAKRQRLLKELQARYASYHSS